MEAAVFSSFWWPYSSSFAKSHWSTLIQQIEPHPQNGNEASKIHSLGVADSYLSLLSGEWSLIPMASKFQKPNHYLLGPLEYVYGENVPVSTMFIISMEVTRHCWEYFCPFTRSMVRMWLLDALDSISALFDYHPYPWMNALPLPISTFPKMVLFWYTCLVKK